MKTLFLIGFRCTGKSTVGSLVASLTGLPFLDLDKEIETLSGTTITRLVETRGWDHFRSLESQSLRNAATGPVCVVATGGGAILDPDNVAVMKKTGTVVLLVADQGIILRRLAEDAATAGQRPSLTGAGVLEESRRVLTRRMPLYRAAAHWEIDTGVLTPMDAAKEIVRRIGHAMK